MYEKLVIVTRRTRLEELIARFNTPGQARFYIEHSGGYFGDYEREHDAYRRSRRPRARCRSAPDRAC